MPRTITGFRHPEYEADCYDFELWRLTYKGGRGFRDRYLVQFSKREDPSDFSERKDMTHIPAYAKLGIKRLKNTFYSRMGEITRKGGDESYIAACRGEGGGVDLYGSSMNAFIGQNILPELMTMASVGIWVDRPPLSGELLSDNVGLNPYLYFYCREDILSWDVEYQQGEYVPTSVLLRDHTYVKKDGIVVGLQEKYRQAWIGPDGKVHIQFWIYDKETDTDIQDGPEVILELSRIPFIMPSLDESLLADVAMYQVGLMNISSADLNYVYKANFPFYTEQFDSVAESAYIRRPRPVRSTLTVEEAATAAAEIGTADTAQDASNRDKINVGSLQGRRYPKGLNAPEFIAPPAEPLLASMKKQEDMKRDIFELLDIAAANAKSSHASAESKSMDDRGLESGLSEIGLELEWTEREIAKIWAEYTHSDIATVKYPAKYKLKSDEDRQSEAKSLNEIKSSAPSTTFAKEVGKLIAGTMLSEKVTDAVLDKINQEIDAAEYTSSDPDMIKIASELGMVDAVTGSNALGFDGKKVVPIAKQEHVARLAEIAKAQSPATNDQKPITGQQQGNKDAKMTPKDLTPNPANDHVHN